MMSKLIGCGQNGMTKGRIRLGLLSAAAITVAAMGVEGSGGEAPDIEMVLVKAGTFTMGCGGSGSDCVDREKPAHQVTLTGDFLIGKYPVTQRQWEAVMGGNPSRFKGNGSHPVEQVSWEDVQNFIAKLNRLTGRQYRLPTEAEWEFAARGGISSKGYIFAGSDEIDSVGWYGHFDRGNSRGGTRPVGTKASNELGIFDMTGNVWEWVDDRYGDYSAEAKTDPKGRQTGGGRVIRGGSWENHAWDCRVTFRNRGFPDYRGRDIGFRLALAP